jgi:hypothetical protein
MGLLFGKSGLHLEGGGSGSNKYIKMPEDGKAIRVLPLGDAVVGFEYWTTENTPVRLPYKPDGVPEGIRRDDKGTPERVKQFIALVCYSFDTESVGLLSLTQLGILQELSALDDDGVFDDHTELLRISRKGTGLKTKYTVSSMGIESLVKRELIKPLPPMSQLFEAMIELDVKAMLWGDSDKEETTERSIM